MKIQLISFLIGFATFAGTTVEWAVTEMPCEASWKHSYADCKGPRAALNRDMGMMKAHVANTKAATHAKETATAKKTTQIAMPEMQSIPFAVNGTNLEPKSENFLNNLAQYMKSNALAKLQVDGYADKSGSTAHNQALSQKRATTVKNFLLKQGVQESQITIQAHGENPGMERKAELKLN